MRFGHGGARCAPSSIGPFERGGRQIGFSRAAHAAARPTRRPCRTPAGPARAALFEADDGRSEDERTGWFLIPRCGPRCACLGGGPRLLSGGRFQSHGVAGRRRAAVDRQPPPGRHASAGHASVSHASARRASGGHAPEGRRVARPADDRLLRKRSGVLARSRAAPAADPNPLPFCAPAAACIFPCRPTQTAPCLTSTACSRTRRPTSRQASWTRSAATCTTSRTTRSRWPSGSWSTA